MRESFQGLQLHNLKTRCVKTFALAHHTLHKQTLSIPLYEYHFLFFHVNISF